MPGFTPRDRSARAEDSEQKRKENERKFNARLSQVYEKEETRAEICSEAYHIFGGMENLATRQLPDKDLWRMFKSHSDIQEITRSAIQSRKLDKQFYRDEDVWNMLLEFRADHVWTSAEAIRAKFTPRDAATLIMEFRLDATSNGNEVPQKDIPWGCQEEMTRWIYNFIRDLAHGFIKKKLGGRLEAAGIDGESQLEISRDRRMEFLETDRVIQHVRNHWLDRHQDSKYPNFNPNYFKKLLYSATDLRNQLEHKKCVSTAYMRKIAQDALELYNHLGLEDGPWEARFQRFRDSLDGWDEWSGENMYDSIDELLRLLEPIEVAIEKIDSTKYTEPLDRQCLVDEKISIGNKIQQRRYRDRKEVGRVFGAHAVDILKNGSTKEFKFPKFREPMVLITPVEDEKPKRQVKVNITEVKSKTAQIKMNMEHKKPTETMGDGCLEEVKMMMGLGTKRSAEDADLEIWGGSSAKKPKLDYDSEDDWRKYAS